MAAAVLYAASAIRYSILPKSQQPASHHLCPSPFSNVITLIYNSANAAAASIVVVVFVIVMFYM